MEELISIIALVVFGIISIISKIVNSRLQTRNDEWSANLPQDQQGQKNHQNAVRPATQSKPGTASAPVNSDQLASAHRKPQMLDNKKALIPDEEEPTVATKPAPAETGQSIKDIIHQTEISSATYGVAKKIKTDRRFAIISHEILGKPKALQEQ